ncbi:MAG: hypothetical protein ABJA82_07955 [Myxococcales bacterium]
MPSQHKTYWHLKEARRVPSPYEIGTSRLLYHTDRGGFAVDLPTGEWYVRHQTGSPLLHPRWEEFEDPRATTYGSYVRMQREQEAYLARVFAPTAVADGAGALPADWLRILDATFSPLRFVFHGFQMAAAYVGQMAPSGRIAVAALFQAADEVRRIHGIARRLGQLRDQLRGQPREQSPDFGADGRERWQSDPCWQPMRRAVETLLITYDWGEALVALNVCLKPMVDHLFTAEFAIGAERQGDHADAQMLRSFADDCAWQRAWTMRLLLGRATAGGDPVARWVARWRPLAEEAAVAAAASLGASGPASAARAAAAVVAWMEPLKSERPDAG